MNINIETPLTDHLGKLSMPIGTFVKMEDCQRIERAFHQKCQEVRDLKARIEAIVKAGDEIIENGSVSERLFNEWNKAKGGA